jgi:hypothetical protein
VSSLDHPSGIPNLEIIRPGHHSTQFLQRSALSPQSLSSLLNSWPWFPHTPLADEQPLSRPTLHWYQRGKVPLFMSKERGEELFRALHILLDAVTKLNLRDLEGEAKAATSLQEAKAESSTQGASTSASASAKGKAKDPDPDWTEVPYNPVPITPLSTRPRFSQVVGSSSESPIVPPSRVPIEAVSLADNPITYSPAVLAAWVAMNNPGKGQDAQNQSGGTQGGGNGDGNGDGQGGNGNAQNGGGQAPLAYNNAGQFLAAWNTAPTDQARDALEQEALSRSPAQDVQFAAMLKTNLRLQASIG